MSTKAISPFQQRIQQPESQNPDLEKLLSLERPPKILHLVNQIAARKNMLRLDHMLMSYLPNYQMVTDFLVRHFLRNTEENLFKNVNESLPMLKHVELCLSRAFSELGNSNDWLRLQGIKSFWSSTSTIDVFVASNTRDTQGLLMYLYHTMLTYFEQKRYKTSDTKIDTKIEEGHFSIRKTSPIELPEGLKIHPRMFDQTSLYYLIIKGPDDLKKNSIQLAFGDVKMTVRICDAWELNCLDGLVDYSFHNPYFTEILYDLTEWTEKYSNEAELEGLGFILKVKDFYEKIKVAGWENLLSDDLNQLLHSDIKYIHLIKPPVSDPLNLITLALEPLFLDSNELNLIRCVFQTYQYVLEHHNLASMVSPCLELLEESLDQKKIGKMILNC